jgi:2-amino-4-hydroxy-6-hydroxymethyldihydropteridine diphosphokinase
MASSTAAGSNRRRVAIALGSNLGDRRAHLDWASARLGEILTAARTSSVLETDPVGVPDEQPAYLNAVVVGETELDPESLLAALMALERERGRERHSFRAARTLDLDLILYDDRTINRPGLEVPHPRFRERDFVLAPLAELEPDWVDPATGKTIGELAVRAKGRGQRAERGQR